LSIKRLNKIFPGLWAYACILILLFSMMPVQAQIKPAAAYQIKAAYLFNFTRFVEWPHDALRATFTIGVVGNKDMSEYLEAIVSGERVNNRPIRVRYYRNLNEVDDCNILFLSTDDAGLIRNGITSLNRRSILTVSDAEDFLHWGGMVRFYTQENKVRIQINASSARAGDLQISSKLLNIATKY